MTMLYLWLFVILSLVQIQLGTKVAKAFDAHRFVEKRKEQEEFKKSKKKKSLHWGFQEKQRWETKGNM